MKALVFMVSIIILSSNVFAGQIRTVHMNADKMKTVHLKMGQSTVIRFTDKPKKVVIGNQNYYSVEFIDNDVTIQPLGLVKSNLFVYTPNHVYGFIMNPRQAGAYDDIVNVRWASSGIVLKRKPIKKDFIERELRHSLKLDRISVQTEKILINKNRGTHIIEFSVINNSLKMLKAKDLKVYLTRSHKKLKVQDYALEQDGVLPFKSVKGRILVKLSEKRGFSFNVEHKNLKKSKVISRWSL